MATSIYTGKEVSNDNPYAGFAAGVDSGNPYTQYTLDPAEKQEQTVAEVMQAGVDKIDADEITAADLGMMARTFIDGMWANKGEEVSSWLSASIVKFLGPQEVYGSRTVSEIRDEILMDEEARTARFQEESPWLAGSANIAGNLLSPLAIKGGQLIAQGNQIRQGVQAANLQTQMATQLGRGVAQPATGGAELAASLASQQLGGGITAQIASGLSKSHPLLNTAGFVGAESALTGFEGDTLGEKATNAGWSAAIGASIPLGFAGVKKYAWDLAIRDPLTQQIGQGKDFINLMFTDHAMSAWYRSVISKAYGARTLTEQQARKVAGKVTTTKQAQEAGRKATAEAGRKSTTAQKIINRNAEESLEEAKIVIQAKIDDLKLQAQNAQGKAKDDLQDQIDELERAKVDSGAAAKEAVLEADEATSASNAFFRGKVLRESAPPGASTDEINELGSLSPQDAISFLDDLWKKHGFTVANGKTYDIDSTGVIKFIDSIEDDFSELALVGGESANIVSSVKKFITEQIEKKAPNGVISGEDLVQLRSTIGRAISGLSEGATSTRRFASEVQTYFDDLLEEGLSKAELEELAGDKVAWSIRGLAEDATVKASGGTNEKLGAFTASDYLNAIKSYSTRFIARGQGRLQKEAEAIAKVDKINEENIVGLANKEAEKIAKEVMAEKKSIQRAAEKQKEALKKQLDEEVKALEAKLAVEKAGTQGAQAVKIAIAKKKEEISLQLADVQGQLDRATNELQAIKDFMPSNFNPSVFESLFNTALVGTIARAPGRLLTQGDEGVAGMAKTVAYGIPVSGLLATEIVQRILARQAPINDVLRGFGASIGSAAEKAGVSMTSTAGGQAGLAAQSIVDQGVMFPAEKREMIMTTPMAGKAGLYKLLQSRGQLERLKAEDPKLFKELKRAYNAGRG